MATAPPLDKIRSLFFSTERSNRDLAFELAKGAACYEQVVTELYEALKELPPFIADKKYWIQIAEEIYEEEGQALPQTVLALQRAQIDGFCWSYFHPTFSLKGTMTVQKNAQVIKTFPKEYQECKSMAGNGSKKCPNSKNSPSNTSNLTVLQR